MSENFRTAIDRINFILVAAVMCISYACANEAITVSDAWIKQGHANAGTLAGYMTISNNSGKEVVLREISGDHFEKIEIHRIEMQGDLMKMIPLDGLMIPAGESVHLQPGIIHLMMIGPVNLPQRGGTVDVVLHFDNGSRVNSSMILKNHENSPEHHH
ncbi:copper chaperone PCu(A)C [bacterium]|nr:copper chaperone PCu(A)C [bacterium]